MRRITDHEVEVAGSDNTLTICVTDEPGSGGANHRYEVKGFNEFQNPSLSHTDIVTQNLTILFQNGPIPQNGVNGITQEILLAIAADRLRCFQAGPFSSADNAEALDHIEKALHALHRRTRERIARNVEGKEVQ